MEKKIIGLLHLCSGPKCLQHRIEKIENGKAVPYSNLVCPYCGMAMYREFIWQGKKFKGRIEWQE